MHHQFPLLTLKIVSLTRTCHHDIAKRSVPIPKLPNRISVKLDNKHHHFFPLYPFLSVFLFLRFHVFPCRRPVSIHHLLLFPPFQIQILQFVKVISLKLVALISSRISSKLAMEMASTPRTVEEIFKDYSARRAGVVRALTYDVDEFYGLCDPEKENLCLYGHPNESWEVNLPAEEVPPELPEPALGINFARDGMNRKDWLSLVAVHSDSWLLSVAFYLGARLNRNERKRLFSLINDLPTVFEVVTERKPVKEKPSVDSGSKSRGSTKRSSDGQVKSTPKLAEESFEDEDDEHSETLCGSCGGNYNADEFWIGCDICERWYHGKCVKITPAKAESIKQYKCPSCMKRNRQ